MRIERELSAIYDDLIDMLPLEQQLLCHYNPIYTGGPKQVIISFVENHAEYYPIVKAIRREVFTLQGGGYFGIRHLIDYPVKYSSMLYHFSDYNAGWDASRNTTFQAAVIQLSSYPLALDVGLIHYDSDKLSMTEKALLT